MATVYIAPTAQGTGDGTSAANAYAYSSLNSAELDAGDGGIILFTDGTYTIASSTWDPAVTTITYKSLNKLGAILTSSAAVTLRLGANDIARYVNFQDFKITGAIDLMSQSNVIMSGVKQIDSISHIPQYAGFYKFAGQWTITDSAVIKDFSGNSDIGFNSTSTITGCTFLIKCSGVGAGGVTGAGPVLKNTIFMSDNSSAIADNVINTSNCTNCCIFQMHSNDTSGGTNNVFTDPLFLEPTNGDLRLRPSSPCIGSNNIQLNEKDKLEAEYPQGVWFDSNASAGGNGSWASPYNDYDDIIDLATGDQLAILVKKGIHPLKQGFKLLSPGNARWNSDLPKKFTDGIIFAGLGDESIFSTDTLDSRPFGGLLDQANSLKPNIYDTPFTFKDLKISISGSSTITRGLIQVSNLTLKKVLIQHTSPGSISSSLFESYTFTTDPNLTLNIDSCQISASLQGSTLLFGSIYKKHIINSTFVDLDSKPTGETTPATYSSSSQFKDSYIENCIFYTKSTVSSGAITPGFNDSSWTLKNVNFYSEHYDWSSILTNNAIKENVQVNPPGFILPEPSLLDLRLRPDSLLIGGVDRKAYKSNAVWIQTGSGTGTGTESDPFYFDQFSDAVLEAVNNTSFQLVLKDGTYIFSTAGAELADSNLSLVTLIAENKHDAIITDNGAAISISGLPSNQALNIKNIKLISDAQFVSNTAIELNANSCLFVIQDSMNFPNVNIDQSILEVKLGFNTSQINSSNGAITNCVFIDKNPGATTTNKVNVAGSIDFKNCIFWSQAARSVDPANGTFKSCASYNYTVTVNATDIIYDGDPGFIDINNSNYNLRPNSPLIGKGK